MQTWLRVRFFLRRHYFGQSWSVEPTQSSDAPQTDRQTDREDDDDVHGADGAPSFFHSIGVIRADSPPFVIQQLECARVALLSSVQWGFGASRETREKRTALKTLGGALRRTSNKCGQPHQSWTLLQAGDLGDTCLMVHT